MKTMLGDRDNLCLKSSAPLGETGWDKWELPQAQVAVAPTYAILADAHRVITRLAVALASSSDSTPRPALLRIDAVRAKIGGNDLNFKR